MGNSINKMQELSDLIQQIQSDGSYTQLIDTISEAIIQAYKSGNKTFFCGNGGSAAEAEHLAAELSGRFNIERSPIPAEACHVNPAFVTAVSNDYDFTKVYSRYIEAFGKTGDVLFGLSTSGNSKNIINAFKAARKIGLVTIAFTGETGGDLKHLSDIILRVPSKIVPRIQEVHLLLGHIICEKVEYSLFGNG